jgi:hypothetical protein
MKWTVEKIPELSGYQIEYAAPRDFYLSRQNRLFRSSDLNSPFTEIAVIDAPAWKQFFAGVRPFQRLLRFMMSNVIALENGDLFVTFDKSVGTIHNGKFQPLKNLIRPCRVLRSACAVDASGDVYFGEYLANDERGEMHVYKYSAGADDLEIVYTFPANSIKHIHGIYFDKYTGALFCLTGDKESECRILRSFDGFKSIETVGSGDETWRAVSILFDENYFYYGTDAEFRENNIYRVKRDGFERENLGGVSGTVFYSKRLGDDLFFATTAENAPSQKENVAALWHIGENTKCEKLISFAKDRWHPTLFMFGTIHFPGVNELENELYFHLVGVENDNQTFRVRRAES